MCVWLKLTVNVSTRGRHTDRDRLIGRVSTIGPIAGERVWAKASWLVRVTFKMVHNTDTHSSALYCKYWQEENGHFSGLPLGGFGPLITLGPAQANWRMRRCQGERSAEAGTRGSAPKQPNHTSHTHTQPNNLRRCQTLEIGGADQHTNELILRINIWADKKHARVAWSSRGEQPPPRL